MLALIKAMEERMKIKWPNRESIEVMIDCGKNLLNNVSACLEKRASGLQLSPQRASSEQHREQMGPW